MNIQIIIQAFLARLLPVYHEVLLGAIRHFHFESYAIAAIQAGIGGLAASALLYGFGRFLKRMPERVSTPQQHARIVKMKQAADSFLPWLLVFAPLPVGSILVIAAGFFDIELRKVAAILITVEILFRTMPYFS